MLSKVLTKAALPMCLALGLVLPVAAAADKITYQCNIKGARDRDWIQPLIFVGHDVSEGRVVVSDAAILGFNNGQPIEGRIVAENNRRITFAWNLSATSGKNQRVTMNYRATYVKSTGKMSVLAQPKGFSNIFNRVGTCEVKKLSG